MGLFDKLFGSKVKSQASNYKHWKIIHRIRSRICSIYWNGI